jgi:hypothetical protein
MKAWFAVLREVVALKVGLKPAGPLQGARSGSNQSADLEQDLEALDRALKETAPRPQAPPTLHRSIMQAVRATERPAPLPGLSFLKWVPAPVLVVVALLVVWQAQRGPVRSPAPNPQSLAAATTALEIGGQMAQSMPGAVVAPLADELARLNRDLNNTAQFLLASLP